MRPILAAAILFASIMALVFGLLWWTRFRMVYNTEGRYLDEQTMVVYDQGAVLAYGSLALLAVVVAVVAAYAKKDY